ncbi:sensor histidine kinase [Microlunatus soli]|uniref:histidine kinase n=1 Tax=Microlunatus soli TaxID=630515 RepID=A0A1H1WG74_9ACTN|nr:sensor histidine kinase [Microlunatus soli]SDS96084.1 Signal transduction histidine kinase [Microlunatus soli]
MAAQRRRRTAVSGAVRPGSERDVPAWVLDALVAVTVACAIALIIAAGQGGNRPPDGWAYVFAAGFGVLILFRRRFPRTMLIMTVLGVFGYYTLDYPPIGVAVPVVAALFAAADAGLVGWAIGAGAVDFAVSMFFRLHNGASIGMLIGYETVSNLALIAMAIALGSTMRLRRRQAAQQQVINQLTADQADARARIRIQTDRERLSRDLHDTVGHTMSVISLHAGVAAESVGVDDGAAAAAISQIRDASSHTLSEVRTMVRLLRSDAAEPSTMSLRQLDELVAPVLASGVEVDTMITIEPSQLRREVDVAGYRIIQEGLTNIVRHAGARHAAITVETDAGNLSIMIADDGTGPVDGPERAPGQGLVGMRERVRALGGVLRAGPGDRGGFTVRATIPLEGGS